MKLSSLIMLGLLLITTSLKADVMQDVKQLQMQWAKANYQLKDKEQVSAFEALIEQAEGMVVKNPDAAEVLIWRGIIKSSFAGVKGGLGALSYAKQAKSDFEAALSINDQALSGSAYTSLGILYLRVPGWPIGFGDDDKAKSLLEKAIELNPQGIDSNYFYGEYLAEEDRYDEARSFLLKAQNAPARPERPLADQGRLKEIKLALQKIEGKHSVADDDDD